jgi:putative DNA-invertase from lambdoid prophage Rac
MKASPASAQKGRRLFDLLRNGDTLVVRWVDRLGRNYQDICDTIREFMRRVPFSASRGPP